MNEALGDGDVQLKKDGMPAGDIRSHLGYESSFTVRRWQLFRSRLTVKLNYTPLFDTQPS